MSILTTGFAKSFSFGVKSTKRLIDSDESITTNFNSNVSGSLLENVSGGDPPYSISSFTINGQQGTIGVLTPITNVGDITINSNGSWFFDPNNAFFGTVPRINYVVTDSKGKNNSSSLYINVLGSLPEITTASLPNVTVGSSYSQTLTANGSIPISWSIVSGNISPLVLNANTGTITGIPTSATTLTATYRATNAFGANDKTMSITVNSAPVIVTTNTLNLNNQSNNIVENYPLQIGRVFKQGEISSGYSPKFTVNGTPITTQVSIKNRWPDNSVKFAVMNAVVPTISANNKPTVSIIPETAGTPDESNNNPNRLLEQGRDFDVSLNFSNGISGNISVRDMISSGAATVWNTGPVSTTWIIADHATKLFDIGADANKSVRPIFHVTLWENLNIYKVRVILEICDTAKLQLQTYSVSITKGLSSPTTVYTSPTISHPSGTRWCKEFWVGQNAPTANLGINHNIGYLASTMAIPNFDSRITISNTQVNSIIGSWNASSKDIFGPGMWTKDMQATAGRPEIGLFTTWDVARLYSDNPELQTAVQLHSDLAAAWPMHFRTGVSTKIFDDTTGTNALGRVITRDAYPTQFINATNQYINSASVSANDRFTILGPTKATVGPSAGWSNDGAHQPDPWYAMYLTTGDYWYLEQLQFWASWGLFNSNPSSATWASGRSPKDTIIQDQVRGEGWLLRTRARAGFISTDNSPEKIYFNRATEQVIRHWEGTFVGPGTNPIRSWWYTNGFISNNVLRHWGGGSTAEAANIPSVTDCYAAISPWQHNYVLMALGHATELGYNSTELFQWFAQSWIGLFNSGQDPRHMADYRMPAVKKAFNAQGQAISGGFYQTWLDAFDDWAGWASAWESNLNDLTHGYSISAIAAASFLRDQPGGVAFWDWVNTNGYSVANYPSNPKMAIVPRSVYPGV